MEQQRKAVLRRVNRLKVAEVAALAAVTPLLVWELTLQKPARVSRFIVDYTVLAEDGRWLPFPLMGSVIIALWYVIWMRGRTLFAFAGNEHRAAIIRDINFRYRWLRVVSLVGMTILFASEFAVWDSFYTPLVLTGIGSGLAALRTWCDSRYSFAMG